MKELLVSDQTFNRIMALVGDGNVDDVLSDCMDAFSPMPPVEYVSEVDKCLILGNLDTSKDYHDVAFEDRIGGTLCTSLKLAYGKYNPSKVIPTYDGTIQRSDQGFRSKLLKRWKKRGIQRGMVGIISDKDRYRCIEDTDIKYDLIKLCSLLKVDIWSADKVIKRVYHVPLNGGQLFAELYDGLVLQIKLTKLYKKHPAWYLEFKRLSCNK